MDNTMDKAIELAMQEEQLTPATAEAKMTASYLDNNLVTLPLRDFLDLKKSDEQLGKLVEAILDKTIANYTNTEIRLDSFNCDDILKIVKDVAPVKYVERYEELIGD